MAIIDIKDVPASPGTGFMPKAVYNPTNVDFTHSWDGTPYIIPAGQSKDFPEFLARHLAKHLAMKIVSSKWEVKIKKDAVGQITPDTAKAIPLIEIQTMMEALMSGKDAFEEIEKKETPIATTITATNPFPEKDNVVSEVKAQPETAVNPLKCPKCDFVGKNANGLRLHSKKHN